MFLCRFLGRLFAVTAGHVVREFEPASACVLVDPGGQEFLEYDGVAKPWTTDVDDPDCCDLAVLTVKEGSADPARFGDSPPMLLHDFDGELSLGFGRLVCRGFPDDGSGIDYDEHRIRMQPVTLEGRWAGRAPMRACHRIALLDVSPCTTLSGFSGSPVFWIGDDGRPPPYAFAGVLIRGSHASKTAMFIDGRMLVRVLRRVVSGEGLPVVPQ